jgi:hypothetical protein
MMGAVILCSFRAERSIRIAGTITGKRKFTMKNIIETIALIFVLIAGITMAATSECILESGFDWIRTSDGTLIQFNEYGLYIALIIGVSFIVFSGYLIAEKINNVLDGLESRI